MNQDNIASTIIASTILLALGMLLFAADGCNTRTEQTTQTRTRARVEMCTTNPDLHECVCGSL